MRLAEEAYLAACEASLASGTMRTRKRIWTDYLGFLQFYGISQTVSSGALLAYLQHLKLRGLHSRTILNYLSALKAQLDSLGVDTGVFNQYTIKAFCRHLTRIPRSVDPKGVLTASEIDTLFGINRSLPDYQPYALVLGWGFMHVCVSRILSLLGGGRLMGIDN